MVGGGVKVVGQGWEGVKVVGQGRGQGWGRVRVKGGGQGRGSWFGSRGWSQRGSRV